MKLIEMLNEAKKYKMTDEENMVHALGSFVKRNGSKYSLNYSSVAANKENIAKYLEELRQRITENIDIDGNKIKAKDLLIFFSKKLKEGTTSVDGENNTDKDHKKNINSQITNKYPNLRKAIDKYSTLEYDEAKLLKASSSLYSTSKAINLKIKRNDATYTDKDEYSSEIESINKEIEDLTSKISNLEKNKDDEDKVDNSKEIEAIKKEIQSIINDLEDQKDEDGESLLDPEELKDYENKIKELENKIVTISNDKTKKTDREQEIEDSKERVKELSKIKEQNPEITDRKTPLTMASVFYNESIKNKVISEEERKKIIETKKEELTKELEWDEAEAKTFEKTIYDMIDKTPSGLAKTLHKDLLKAATNNGFEINPFIEEKAKELGIKNDGMNEFSSTIKEFYKETLIYHVRSAVKEFTKEFGEKDITDKDIKEFLANYNSSLGLSDYNKFKTMFKNAVRATDKEPSDYSPNEKPFKTNNLNYENERQGEIIDKGTTTINSIDNFLRSNEKLLPANETGSIERLKKIRSEIVRIAEKKNSKYMSKDEKNILDKEKQDKKTQEKLNREENAKNKKASRIERKFQKADERDIKKRKEAEEIQLGAESGVGASIVTEEVDLFKLMRGEFSSLEEGQISDGFTAGQIEGYKKEAEKIINDLTTKYGLITKAANIDAEKQREELSKLEKDVFNFGQNILSFANKGDFNSVFNAVRNSEDIFEKIDEISSRYGATKKEANGKHGFGAAVIEKMDSLRDKMIDKIEAVSTLLSSLHRESIKTHLVKESEEEQPIETEAKKTNALPNLAQTTDEKTALINYLSEIVKSFRERKKDKLDDPRVSFWANNFINIQKKKAQPQQPKPVQQIQQSQPVQQVQQVPQPVQQTTINGKPSNIQQPNIIPQNIQQPKGLLAKAKKVNGMASKITERTKEILKLIL